MSNRRIGQPVGQILMTNVAVVRYKRNGKRFEVACYKNKVLNWRNGVEKDLSEVLQTTKVYENVSKGKFARKCDWVEAFHVNQDEEACRIILEHGELQVSEGERKAQTENMYRDIATIIAEKCVNPASNRPYPYSVVERLMKEIHVGVVLNRSAKQQALDIIKKMQLKKIPIERAKMKIQITVDDAPNETQSIVQLIADSILEHERTYLVTKDLQVATKRAVFLIHPGNFRIVDEIIHRIGKGRINLEVLDLCAQEQGAQNIEDEIAMKTERIKLSQPKDFPPPPPMDTLKKTGDLSSVPKAPSTSEKRSSPSSKDVGPSHHSCTTCGGSFPDVSNYRQHFRSDWHRYNLKVKAKKRDTISEQAFLHLKPREIQAVFECE